MMRLRPSAGVLDASELIAAYTSTSIHHAGDVDEHSPMNNQIRHLLSGWTGVSWLDRLMAPHTAR